MRIRSKPCMAPPPSPQQLWIALDSDVLRGLSHEERARAIAQLANLLLLAAGVTVKEPDDDD